MTVLERLADWFRTPVIEIEVYECPDCGFETSDRSTTCPDCGESLRRLDSYEYGYWEPLG